MESSPVTGTFEIAMRPSADAPRPDDTRARIHFTKTWQGPLAGASDGEMLTAGTPALGAAGYVALERFEGTLAGRHGSFVLQHCGTMLAGRDDLLLVVSPGSGTGALAGIAGTMRIASAGGHRYTFEYALPEAYSA